MQNAIRHLAGGENLSREEMQSVMGIIMAGEATPSQIGAFLVALHIKGETVEEIEGAAQTMRDLAVKVDVPELEIVDAVGTGGDHAGLFNVTTASALVTAEAGAHVAKHGNRAATSRSGSFDMLETAGINIEINAEQVAHCIRELGIGFMFAPTHHGATRHAVGPRREIGVRTVFNVLGPLTNPAGAKRQLVGVFAKQWVRPIAEVLHRLDSVHSLVVCSDDGLDEISIAADTQAAEMKDGKISEFIIKPTNYGIELSSLEPLKVSGSEQSLKLIRSALSGEFGPAYDMVAINAGATIYVAGLVHDLAQGVEQAREILQSGKALQRMEELAAFTQQFKPEED